MNNEWKHAIKFMKSNKLYKTMFGWHPVCFWVYVVAAMITGGGFLIDRLAGVVSTTGEQFFFSVLPAVAMRLLCMASGLCEVSLLDDMLVSFAVTYVLGMITTGYAWISAVVMPCVRSECCLYFTREKYPWRGIEICGRKGCRLCDAVVAGGDCCGWFGGCRNMAWTSNIGAYLQKNAGWHVFCWIRRRRSGKGDV